MKNILVLCSMLLCSIGIAEDREQLQASLGHMLPTGVVVQAGSAYEEVMPGRSRVSIGSGTVLSVHDHYGVCLGQVLTANHVLDWLPRDGGLNTSAVIADTTDVPTLIRVQLPKYDTQYTINKVQTVPASVVCASKEQDLALLNVSFRDCKGLHGARVAPSTSKLLPLQRVWLVGSAGGLGTGIAVYEGRVTQKVASTVGGEYYFSIGVAVYGGMSGGGVFAQGADADGQELAGVFHGRTSVSPSLNRITDAAAIRKFLSSCDAVR